MSLYLITNTTNERYYVGKTTGYLCRRWSSHKYAARKNRSGYLYNAMRKCGIENFIIQEISSQKDNEKLSNLEKVWIILLQANDRNYGYNLTTGGEGTQGFSHVAWNKGKSYNKKYCPSGHELTENNLIRRKNCNHRCCLTCHRLRQRKYNQNKSGTE